MFESLTQPDLSLAAVALKVVEVETFLMLNLTVLLLERFKPLTTSKHLLSKSRHVCMFMCVKVCCTNQRQDSVYMLI